MPYKATTGGLSVLPKPSVLLNYELLVSCCGPTITGTLGLETGRADGLAGKTAITVGFEA